MPRTGLKVWNDIAPVFRHSLLLGNGASVEFHGGFNYKDLLGHAAELGHVNPQVASIFELFDTTDFEYVLRLVWRAHLLNISLEIPEIRTEAAYLQLRHALIQTVREMHPSYADMVTHLPVFGSFLRRFSTIVSLNYDLILYWAHMYSRDEKPEIDLKDCFINGNFRHNWEALREPVAGTKRAILVFYPHGNLALAVDPHGDERKVNVGSASNLLSAIERNWRQYNWLPLFVSEGSSPEKLASIYRSEYLTEILEGVLPSSGPSLVIYGWSMGDADDHILKAVLSGNVRRIAVSVHTSNSSWRDYRDLVRKKVKKLSRPKYRPKVIFFDAATAQLRAEQMEEAFTA